LEERAEAATDAVHDHQGASIVAGRVAAALLGPQPGDALEVVLALRSLQRVVPQVDAVAKIGRDDDAHGPAQVEDVAFRTGFLDAMTELLQQPGGRLDSLDAFGMDGRAGDWLFLEGDAQPARLRANLLQERPRRRRGPIGIARRGAAGGVE